MDDLHKKLDRVKDEHAVEIVTQRSDDHDQRSRDEAMFMLGRIWQNDHIAEAIDANLKGQTILALERFQKDKRYLSLGYDTFDEFLNNCPESKLSKRQYYDRLALVRGHGEEIYDLLTSVGISVRAQKMLGAGELSIKDDQLCIGDRAVSLADAGIIKDVLNEMFDEKRTLLADREKLTRVNDKLKSQITQGSDEYNQLQRNFDALREGDPHDRAVARAIQSLLEVTECAGQLSDDKKAAKGKDTVQTLFAVILKVRDAYGISTPLTDKSSPPYEGGVAAAAADGVVLSPAMIASINADDDLDMEDDD